MSKITQCTGRNLNGGQCRRPQAPNSNKCGLHQSQNVVNKAAAFASVPKSSHSYFSSDPVFTNEAELLNSVYKVFPDMSNVGSRESIREQVIGTIRTAVQVEAFRRFQEANSSEAAERDRLLRDTFAAIMDKMKLAPSSLNVEGAMILSNSESDARGRCLKSSAKLASWGARVEWEMGRLDGTIPSNKDLRTFCNELNREVMQTTEQVLKEQASQWVSILGETGDGPRCAAPLPPDLVSEPLFRRDNVDEILEDEMSTYHAIQEEAEQAHSEENTYSEEARANREKVSKILLKAGVKTAEFLWETRQQVKSENAERRIAAEEAEHRRNIAQIAHDSRRREAAIRSKQIRNFFK